jgi:hypothetical protein
MPESAAYFREKTARCRRIAQMINDPAAVRELNRMAAEFETKAAAIEAAELTDGQAPEKR